MSSKGKHGMRIDLDKVPVRQENMKPYEILLSESQERMLIVVEKGKEALVEAVFDKWDLNCAIIGEVTDTERLQYYANGELVADVTADDLRSEERRVGTESVSTCRCRRGRYN